jgi:hypothetical protein
MNWRQALTSLRSSHRAGLIPQSPRAAPAHASGAAGYELISYESFVAAGNVYFL